VRGKKTVSPSPIGILPKEDAIALNGKYEPLFAIDREAWQKEVEEIRNYFAKFGERLPPGIRDELDKLEKRLKNEIDSAKGKTGTGKS